MDLASLLGDRLSMRVDLTAGRGVVLYAEAVLRQRGKPVTQKGSIRIVTR